MATGVVRDGKSSKLVTPDHVRRFDRFFFFITSWLMLVTAYEGFAPTYYRAGLFRAPLPSPIIHVHAVAFSCWMLLLVAQTSLVSARRVDIHRRLGIAGFLLGCLMVILGVLSATDSLVRGVAPPGSNPKSFYIVPMSEMLIFGTLLFFAFRDRRVSPAHKRIIYIATNTLLAAAVARLPIPGIATNGAIATLYSNIFLLLLVIYDLFSLRRVHRVTLWAGAFMIFVEQIRYPFAETALWQSIATGVLKFVR